MLGAGCATQGIGAGELETPASRPDVPRPLGPVNFRWHSDGQVKTRGAISAVLPDGRSFEGRFSQVLHEHQPIWSLNTFAADGNEITDYTGDLLASLHASDGSWMHCWFDLTDPRAGPGGGAEGTCQLSEGEEIEHATLSGPSPEAPRSPSKVSQAH